jgi:hypothetical protein
LPPESGLPIITATIRMHKTCDLAKLYLFVRWQKGMAGAFA